MPIPTLFSLGLVRHLIQPSVQTAESEQLRLSALLDDTTVLHGSNPVRSAYRGKPMCDYERSPSLQKRLKRLLDSGLSCTVHPGCGLIQNDDLGIGRDRS